MINLIYRIARYFACIICFGLAFYDGYEKQDRFLVVNLSTSRSPVKLLPRRYFSIIVSLEGSFWDPTLQLWTTLLSSDKPIASSEILHEVTDKWCTNVVHSHLKFYQQQLRDYLHLPCNTIAKTAEQKHRTEFVEKTVRLLKSILQNESEYIQQGCEDRLRKDISEDNTAKTFDSDLQKTTASCAAGVQSSNTNIEKDSMLTEELTDCRQALHKKQESLRQQNSELMREQAKLVDMDFEQNRLIEELMQSNNLVTKLQRRIVRLQEVVKKEENLANDLLTEKLTRLPEVETEENALTEQLAQCNNSTIKLHNRIKRLQVVFKKEELFANQLLLEKQGLLNSIERELLKCNSSADKMQSRIVRLQERVKEEEKIANDLLKKCECNVKLASK